MNSESSDLLALVNELTTKLKVQAIGDPAAEESLVQQISKLHSVALARFGWHQLRRSEEFRERFVRATAEASDAASNKRTADDSEWLERALEDDRWPQLGTARGSLLIFRGSPDARLG